MCKEEFKTPNKSAVSNNTRASQVKVERTTSDKKDSNLGKRRHEANQQQLDEELMNQQVDNNEESTKINKML
jgi:hypothetical protein